MLVGLRALRYRGAVRRPALLASTQCSYSSSHSSLPRIAQPSLWSSIIPKPLRGSSKGALVRAKGLFSGDWNPATFFIVMSLLIGSNAIQMVTLKTRRLNYKRTTEAKLSLLQEVIGRVQRGEDVDVEAMLGKGDPEQEKEWEEVMKDLERDEDLWEEQSKKSKKNPAVESVVEQTRTPTKAEAAVAPVDPANRKPGFY